MKHKIVPRALLIFTLSGLSLITGTRAEVHLVYSSDLVGELKPCGCTEKANLGGLLRRATIINQIRQDKPGTVFVSAGDILADHNAQGKIKNRFILEAYAQLGMDALLPGERELSLPHAVLDSKELRWVLTNNRAYNFPGYRIRQLSTGRRIIIFGLIDPQVLDNNTRDELLSPQTAFEAALTQSAASTDDFVVLLLHGKDEFAETFRNYPLVDVIVRGHHHDPIPLQQQSRIPVLSSGYRGQSIGLARFDAQTQTLTDNRIITLGERIIDFADMTDLYRRYDEAVTQWYRELALERKRVAPQTSPYATDSACKLCHKLIHQQWTGTRHANAINSLRRVKKDHDPECLVCHTTGMGDNGGFISIKTTASLVNVQCESCHGPAREHSAYPLGHHPQRAVNRCTQCHTRENSPEFRFSAYLPKVVHQTLQVTPVHQQRLSAIAGLYDLIDKDKPVLGKGPIEVIEFFNFYCSRCYVLNAGWQEMLSGLKRPIVHRQIPVTIGDSQQPWATLAYLVAAAEGKAESMKNAIFKAKFEQDRDIGKREVIIDIASTIGIENEVTNVLYQSDTSYDKKLQQGMALFAKYDLHSTPAIVINDNLSVLPGHSADNTNLMLENLGEIITDMQCRQTYGCKKTYQ